MNNIDLTQYQSLFTQTPITEASERYSLISTKEVIDLLGKEGWIPSLIEEGRIRKEGRRGFQKHMVRFEHTDMMLNEKDKVEIILVNSHDRSTSYKLLAGIFRFVCSNGLIMGNTFGGIKLKHQDLNIEDIFESTFKIMDSVQDIKVHVDGMQGRIMKKREKLEFAEQAGKIYRKDLPFRPERLLEPRRDSDIGSNLWATYNVAQENIIQGKINYLIEDVNEKVRSQTTRRIKDINRQVQINQELWNLASGYM